MAEVFISYSRTDSDFVHVLDDHLRSQERDVWVDWEDIAPADDWQQNIYDNIDAAESFVFVVSAKSLESQYCGKELARAVQGGKKIIPIACDAADPDLAPPALATPNWIWCREGDDRGVAFEKLTSAIETDLPWTKAHTRLLVRAVEWDARKDGSLLLRGADLRDAEQNLAANGGKQPAPTELQQRYVLASRRAATRRQRIMLGSAAVAVAVALGLAALALLQRNDARAATRAAGANAAASSASNPDAPLDLSLLLGYASYRTKPDLPERSSVLGALEAARDSGVVRIFRGHTSTVLGVAISPDGHTLASAGADGTVRLWDARGGSHPVVLRVGGGAVDSVAFDRDGRILASAGADGTVRLWDVRSRRQLDVLRGHTGPVNAIAFGKGAMLASGGADGTIRLWDGSRPAGAIHLKEGPVNGVAFSPNGRILASAADGPRLRGPGVVRMWDVGTLNAVGRPMYHLGGYHALSVSFSPDGRTLASSGADGIVKLWHVPGGTLAAASGTINDFSAIAMHDVAFAPHGGLLASSSADGTIFLWKVGSRGALVRTKTLTGEQGDVYGVAFGRDGRTLVSGGADKTVRVWDVRGRQELPQGGFVTGIAFAPDGHTILAGGEGGRQAQFWDVRSLRASGRLDRATGDVESVAVSPRAGLFATGGSGGTIRLWDLHGRFLRQMSSGSGPVRGLAFSPDGHTLASANADDTIQTWNVLTGRATTVRPLHGPVQYDYGTNSVAFGEHGHLLASGGDDYTVRLWNLRTRRRAGVLRGDTSWIATVAFSPDGSILASADWDGTVRLWNVRTHRQIGAPFRGHDGPVEAVAFSPDGSMLASGGDDSTVRLWDVNSHRQLGEALPAGTGGGAVNAVAFSPNGRVLVAASADGKVRIWRGIFWRDLSGLRALVCGTIAGSLTKAEMQTYAPGLPDQPLCPD